jgi:hypothetical protein
MAETRKSIQKSLTLNNPRFGSGSSSGSVIGSGIRYAMRFRLTDAMIFNHYSMADSLAGHKYPK